MTAYRYTNPGGRGVNEDFAGFQADGSRGIFILADGLGGHQGGAQASEHVVKSLLEAWNSAGDGADVPDWPVWLEERAVLVNGSLMKAQQELGNNMKSTLASLVVDGGRAAWSWVGDSRIYRLSEGEIAQVTRDHSVSYKKFMSGEISRNQINFDEDRASLLRVVGDETRCLPETGFAAAAPGDAFLLCSDGFWEYLYDEEILSDRLCADTPQAWAERMLLRVLPRMQEGSDNLTLITIFIVEEEPCEKDV